MELKIKIGYKEILELIKQLPPSQILLLVSELEKGINSNTSNQNKPSLQNILLNSPTMSSKQYEIFKENRKHFSH